MNRKMQRIKAQAMFESILILTFMITFLIGAYICGKILLLKTNQSEINRANAFANTYRNSKNIREPVKKDEHNVSGSEYTLHSEDANSSKTYGSYGFLGKILNSMHNTKKYETKASTNIQRELCNFIKCDKYQFDNSEKVFMDSGTYYKSDKLKAALYAMAFAKSFAPKGTKLDALGKGLLDTSKEFREKEDIFLE